MNGSKCEMLLVGFEQSHHHLAGACALMQQTLTKSNRTLKDTGPYCPFLKYHEPWFHDTDHPKTRAITKAAILIRHPFDAGLAEFKRYTS